MSEESRFDDQAAAGGEPAGVPVGHEGTRVEIEERAAWSANGFVPLVLAVVFFVGALRCFIEAAARDDAGLGTGPGPGSVRRW